MNDGKQDFFIKPDDPRRSTLKYGRLKGFDKEAREKMSLAGKGRTHNEKTKLKISKSQTGLRFWTNGEVTVRTYECPEGFIPGMAKAFKHKQ